MAVTAFRDEWVEATYRPATAYAVHDPAHDLDPGAGHDPSDFGAACALRHSGPNASRPGTSMRPEGRDRFARLAADPDARVVVDLASGDPIPRDGRPPAPLTRGTGSPHVRYALSGDPVTLSRSMSGGLRGADGERVADVGTALAGLCRLDGSGMPICMADDPLCVQRAAIFAANGGDPSHAGDPAITAHLRHMLCCADAARQASTLSPGAWTDLAALDEAAGNDGGKASVPPAHGIDAWVADAIGRLADRHEGRPSGTYGPTLNVRASSWLTRLHEGSGWIWTIVDALAATVTPKGWTPSPRAMLVGYGQSVDAGEARRIRAHIAGLERIGEGRDVTAHRDGDDVVVIDRRGGRHVMAVHPPTADEAMPLDPLMTEEIRHTALGDRPARMHDRTLGRLTLLAGIVPPRLMPEYPYRVLVRAERLGLGLHDFAAAYAQAARWPVDGPAVDALVETLEGLGLGDADQGEGDGSWPPRWFQDFAADNARAADRLEALGGRADPLLVAAARSFVGDMPIVDLDGEADLLVAACGARADLRDLALEALLAQVEIASPGSGVTDANPSEAPPFGPDAPSDETSRHALAISLAPPRAPRPGRMPRW